MTQSLASTPTALNSVAMSKRLLIEGAALGACYGILLRLFVGARWIDKWLSAHDAHNITAVMTWAFVLGGPFVIGFLCISRASKLVPASLAESIFAPWISILVMMFALWLTLIEGLICIVMALPIALVLSSLGGLAAKVYSQLRRPSNVTLSCVAFLPLLAAPGETLLHTPTQTRTVSSEIRIHASPQIVWQNIERVPAINPLELKPNWTHRIGFPRPVEATLSFEGVGGVRHASFERGLKFIETVTEWQPDHQLAFTIKADSAHIPTTTLDEHVTIGGAYFDVLDGQYTIEQIGPNDVTLHLLSRERLSTDFNGYAGLWTDGVMQSLQTSILEVIQHRCEEK